MTIHRHIYRKRKYHLLSYLLPTWCLKRKARRGYLARVSTELVNGKFLDVGCGPGIAATLYGRSRGSLSIGVDLSTKVLAVARAEGLRHRSHARFVRARAEHLPFSDESFDTVYLGQILEHLEEVDPALAEAGRVLKPGGLLVLSVPDRDLVPFEGHVRTFDENSVRGLFLERGYTGVALYPYDDRRLVCSGTKPSSAAPAARCASYTT